MAVIGINYALTLINKMTTKDKIIAQGIADRNARQEHVRQVFEFRAQLFLMLMYIPFTKVEQEAYDMTIIRLSKNPLNPAVVDQVYARRIVKSHISPIYPES